MKYDNVKCPVCDEVFTPESDVVVCPECGTPHHRDCYLKAGQCHNDEKHSDGYTWINPNASSVPVSEPAKKTEPPKVIAGGVVTPEMAPNGAVPAIEVDRDGNTRAVYRAISANEKIGEFTVEEYGKVVQKNIHKYIPKFMMLERTQSKFSVNWAAFFFGPFWLFYRKMYKYGAIALLLLSILPLIFMGDVLTYSEETTAAYNEFVEIMLADADMSDDELSAMTEEVMEKMPVEPTVLRVSSYIEFAISVALGFFGNLLYKKHCEEILLDAKSLKDNPDEWNAKIARSGGRTILAVLMAYAAFTIIVAIFSAVYTATGSDIATLLRGLMNG